MTHETKTTRSAGRFRKFWARPLLESEASRLSQAIDREAEVPGSSDDPALAAIFKAAHPQPIPDGFRERSWTALERELFPSPAVHPPLSVPFRDRRGPSFLTALLYQVPRIVVVGLALLAGMAAYGVCRGPYLLARPIVDRASVSWSHVRNYDGDVQFISLIPGLQMQWSGRQIYMAPDRMRLQVTLMGIRSVMTVNGDAGAVDVSGTAMNKESLARFRFLARSLRPDGVLEALENSPEVRYEGLQQVLAQDCQALFFLIPGREEPGGGTALLYDAVPAVQSGRVWLSRSQCLPVQVELYRKDGSLAVSYRFSQIATNVSLTPDLFNIPLKNGRPPMDGEILRQSSMRVQLVGFHLPEAFGK